jgi:AcrR family transcriptional regulator
VSPLAGATAAGTRDRLLDATDRGRRRSGIRRTTVSEVAAEAGLSRAWLYRHFPDKESLIAAALVRTDEAFWAAAHECVSAAGGLGGLGGLDGLGAQVAAAVRFSREQRPGALMLQLQAEEPEAFAATIGTGVNELMPGMAVFWHRYLEQARSRGEVRADLSIPRAAEWVMRIVLSLVTVPGDAIDADDAASVRRFVDEFLVAGLR